MNARLLHTASLALFLGFTGCTGGPSGTASISDETLSALALLPADASIVAMVDAAALRDSDLLKATGPAPFSLDHFRGPGHERVRAFLDATGFDPTADLKSVYVALDAPGADPMMSLVAFARYDTPRLEAFFRKERPEAMDRTSYRGVTIFRQTSEPVSMYLALPGDNVILASTRETQIHAMLDRKAGTGRSLKDDDAAMRLIASTGQGQAWGVVRGLNTDTLPTPSGGTQIPAEVLQLGRAVTAVALSGSAGRNALSGALTLVPRDDVDTEDLAALVRGLISLVKSRPELNDAQMRALDRVEVRTTDGLVRVTGSLERALLAELH